MRLAVLFSLLLFSYLVSAIELDEGVYVLTTDSFDSFVDGEDISLVEFYAPWCGHCKKLAPEFVIAAKSLKDNVPPVKLAKVDATVESDLATRFGVTSYPTLKIFRHGSATDYKGPREAAGIVSFMKKQASPSVTELKSVEAVEKFIEDDAAVIFFGDASTDGYKTFSKIAEKYRETYRFARAEAKEVLDHYGHKAGEIVFFQAKRFSQSPLEKAKAVYTKDSSEHLFEWLKENFLPLAGDINADTKDHYANLEKPVVKVYSSLDWKLNPKGANYLLNKLRKAAKDFADKFVFGFAHKGLYAKEAEDLQLNGDFPFAIFDKKGGKYPSREQFTAESLKQHLEDFLAGKLESFIKSEPIPESQDPEGPVVVVGKTFEQIVLDPTKDVLIEAYAPWCGHCKSLEPKYKELAKKLQKYSDTLTIAKIDATANDLPPGYSARGFPTIFFAPANNKDSPLTYDSAREVKDFENYIKRHASLPLKAKSGKDEL